jgi:hypothetical protein
MTEYLLVFFAFVTTVLAIVGPTRDDAKPFPKNITKVGRITLVVGVVIAGSLVYRTHQRAGEAQAKVGRARSLIESAANSYRSTINQQLSYLTDETPTAALEKLERGIPEARKRFRDAALAATPILGDAESSLLVEILGQDESCWYFGDRRWFFTEKFDPHVWVSNPDKLFFQMTLLCACPLSYRIGLLERNLGSSAAIGETELCRHFRDQIGLGETWHYSD